MKKLRFATAHVTVADLKKAMFLLEVLHGIDSRPPEIEVDGHVFQLDESDGGYTHAPQFCSPLLLVIE